MKDKEEIVSPRKKLALKLGSIGGGMGVLSGLIQILAGSKVSSITGNEDDFLILGLLTIILSGFALYCTYRSSRENSTDIDKRTAWLLGIAVPGIICFITVGFFWLLSGTVFFISIAIFVLEMIKEFEEAGEKIIASVPYWKKTAALAGVFLVLIPVVFGSFTENTELSSFKDEDGTYRIQPMNSVKREGDDGNITSSKVTGVMMVHMALLISGFAALISSQLGARIITILSGVVLTLTLLFFLFFIPNILFIEGAQVTQFDSNHFSSISGGWYMAMFGSILVVASQFIKIRTGKDKSTERS